MSIPPEHRAYLQRQGYTPRCPVALSDEEAALLLRYGYWLEALASGAITPATPEQEHFLQVVQGAAVAKTAFEQVWTKLRNDQAEKMPSAPSTGPETGPAEPYKEIEQLDEARRYLDDLQGRLNDEREEILKAIQSELEALEEEYAQRLQDARRAVADLESEVKTAVLQLGKSMQAGSVQAVFYRGRVSWDSKALARYAESNPEVEQFRKVGEPSVVVRYR